MALPSLEQYKLAYPQLNRDNPAALEDQYRTFADQFAQTTAQEFASLCKEYNLEHLMFTMDSLPKGDMPPCDPETMVASHRCKLKTLELERLQNILDQVQYPNLGNGRK